MHEGTQVRVHGLKKATRYNDKYGLVLRTSSGKPDVTPRIRVRMQSGECIQVKPTNLEEIPLTTSQIPSGVHPPGSTFDFEKLLEPLPNTTRNHLKNPIGVGKDSSKPIGLPSPTERLHVDQNYDSHYKRSAIAEKHVRHNASIEPLFVASKCMGVGF